MLSGRVFVAVLVLLAFAGRSTAARAAGDPAVAALQVALGRAGAYRGTIDGHADRKTRAAIRRFQARSHLAVDGVAGRQTRRALGRFARHGLGSRLLRRGAAGWDVAEVQFELAWAGFPSGDFDGRFGLHVEGAVRRFQREQGMAVDGVVGARTLVALRAPPPEPATHLAWPVLRAKVGDRFGPRGRRFHAGVDLIAPQGTPVTAAARGRVVWAAWREGWGLLVAVAHGNGVRTLYAHLSKIAVRLGGRVTTGTVLGQVGSTGDATGPHLHFEVRDESAAIDPLALLPPGDGGA